MAIGLLLFINLILAYFFGANSFVLLTPVSLGLISYLVFFKMQNIGMIYKVILSIILMIILDIGIKQLSGGSFDQVGQALIQLELVVSMKMQPKIMLVL